MVINQPRTPVVNTKRALILLQDQLVGQRVFWFISCTVKPPTIPNYAYLTDMPF